MFYFIGGFVLIIVAFVWWRWTSVARGARQRNEKILRLIDPIGTKLHSGRTVTPDEVSGLARRPEVRHMLFAVLRDAKRPDLIPQDYSSEIHQAASALAYWMMHPNELQDAPAEMELVETVQRPLGGKPANFYVFRCRMPEHHWAAKNGWLRGLAGPFFGDEEPYHSLPGAFSRCGDKHGTMKPADLVDWYLGVLHKKAVAV